MNLFAELRKRNVFRVAAAYLVGAWIVMQVVGLIAGATGLPDWTDTMVLIILIAGFPIVALAAWALELTPDGIKPSGTATELEAKPVGATDYVLIAAVVVILGLFGWQMLATPQPASQAESAVAAEAVRVQQSIAVLPFVAISDDPEDIVLGDGLAEELLNVLAQFPDLAVAGRTSSFSFRDRAEDITTIGAALGVNHVLEGSVRRSNDQIRVTAQLIRTSDGFHVWSGNYDRPFRDILQVQDDIVRRIAQVLTIRLGVGPELNTTETSANGAAYEQYLRGRVLWAQREEGGNRYAALDAFQTAVDIDPDFADAWAGLARGLLYSDPPEGYVLEEHLARAKAAADHALALDPNNAEALVALANWYTDAAGEWLAAEEAIERALALAPNAAYTHYGAAHIFEVLGNVDRMTRAIRRTVALDPLNMTVLSNVAARYARAGRFAEARRIASGGTVDRVRAVSIDVVIAIEERDADALEDLFEESMRLFVEDDPNFAELRPDFEVLLRGYEVAMRGDLDQVHELIPQIEEILARGGPLCDCDPATVLYFAGQYEEAAGRLLVLYERGSGFDNFDVVRTAQTLDTGFRCQADYHAIWALETYPALAEIRRANGGIGNLPLSGPECEPYLAASAE